MKFPSGQFDFFRMSKCFQFKNRLKAGLSCSGQFKTTLWATNLTFFSVWEASSVSDRFKAALSCSEMLKEIFSETGSAVLSVWAVFSVTDSFKATFRASGSTSSIAWMFSSVSFRLNRFRVALTSSKQFSKRPLRVPERFQASLVVPKRIIRCSQWFKTTLLTAGLTRLLQITFRSGQFNFFHQLNVFKRLWPFEKGFNRFVWFKTTLQTYDSTGLNSFQRLKLFQSGSKLLRTALSKF